jgi:hypothetical protein
VSYVADANDALADLAAAGATAVFSRTTVTYDGTTGAATQSVTMATTSGIAKVPSGADRERLKQLDLINVQTVVLLVAGVALGQYQPRPNDLVSWAGESYTVRDVSLLAPDGVTPILYTVYAAR